MKASLIPLVTLLVAQPLHAQDTAPLDEARKIAHKLQTTLAASPMVAPIAVDADADKPALLKAANKAGLLIVPDRSLTSAAIDAAGSAPIPVAQLWTRDLVLAQDGQRPATSQLRTVTVSDGTQDVAVQLYHLAVQKDAKGNTELAVFANDKTAVAHVPIEKTNGTVQELPLALSGRKTSDDTGVLTIDLFGRYKAELAVLKAGE